MLMIRLTLAFVLVLSLGFTPEQEPVIQATINLAPRPTRVVVRSWPRLVVIEAPKPHLSTVVPQQGVSAYEMEPCRSALYRAPVVVNGAVVALACGNDQAALVAGEAEGRLKSACWYSNGEVTGPCPPILDDVAEALRRSNRLPARYQ